MLVRDPVWGDIELPDWTRSLLDTREMQRLRRIRQLGLAYLVYPGAQHSRFEHSLGTANAARLILTAIGREGDPWADAVLIAALLHDIAHVPFGHTFEDERPLLPRHDTEGRMRPALAGDIRRPLHELPAGEQALGLLLGDGAVPHWARDVVSGPLDADLLDYLRRDAYMTGIRQQYDERVLQTLEVVDGRLGVRLERHGRIRPDARSEILQLFRMRYLLTERVYLHHTKIAAGAMVAKAVELACEQGLDPTSLLGLGDDALLDLLASGQYGDEAKELADAVGCRRLYKRAFVLDRPSAGQARLEQLRLALEPRSARREAEERIARAGGAPSVQVVISCPPPPEFREMRVPTRLPSGVYPLDAPPGGDREVDLLADRYRDLWAVSVFVAPGLMPRAADIARAFLREI